MSDINSVHISGNLTRDPESVSEGRVARLSIASNRSFRRNGEEDWTEEVTFVEVSAFNGLAKRILGKLRKGDKITLEGRLELNRWVAEDGTNRQQLRLIAQNAVAEGFFRKSDSQPPSPSEVAEAPEAEATEAPAAAAAATAQTDDIPF